MRVCQTLRRNKNPLCASEIGELTAGTVSEDDAAYGLLDVVRNAKASVLIGVSGQGGLFKEAVVRAMAELNERPIILPLSNPTVRAEAQPEDIVRWSEGRALMATGSPVCAGLRRRGRAYGFPVQQFLRFPRHGARCPCRFRPARFG